MNCQVVRKHLLGSERPGRPPAEASAHLAACAACREWQQRLVQMEQAMSLLPVPPADAARAALVRRVLTGLLGAPLPAAWDDVTAALKGTGREPLGEQDRQALGPLAARFPLFA